MTKNSIPKIVADSAIPFLRGVLERGDVCSAIDALRLGYRSSQSFGSDIQLSPTWLITPT